MRQSKAVGRTAGSVRRVALTSLGAGLVVGAAAPMASAATIADDAPLASSTALTSSAPLASSADAASLAPIPLAAPVTSMAGPGLADDALTLSTAALSGANANWSHLGRLKLYPFAGTGLDPLSNMVSTDLGGIPVSTAPVSQMMSDGLPVTDLPVVGALFGTPQD